MHLKVALTKTKAKCLEYVDINRQVITKLMAQRKKSSWQHDLFLQIIVNWWILENCSLHDRSKLFLFIEIPITILFWFHLNNTQIWKMFMSYTVFHRSDILMNQIYLFWVECREFSRENIVRILHPQSLSCEYMVVDSNQF